MRISIVAVLTVLVSVMTCQTEEQVQCVGNFVLSVNVDLINTQAIFDNCEGLALMVRSA